jgi:hypothetical protein
MATNRVSGIQKQVFALYRTVLRAALQKDRETVGGKLGALLAHKNDSTLPSTSTSYAATEFRKQSLAVKRSEFKKIEYMIRKAEKQVKLLQMPGVKVVGRTN